MVISIIAQSKYIRYINLSMYLNTQVPVMLAFGSCPPYLPKILKVSEAGPAGIIVFTLGMTGYDASIVPKQLITAIMNAFSKMPQRLVFRFVPELVENKPDNVLVLNWIPQIDLLG